MTGDVADAGVVWGFQRQTVMLSFDAILPMKRASDTVTVLEGTWTAGTGPKFDPGKARLLQPGCVMVHPAGGVHWDGSSNDAPVVVQIVGIGPVTTTTLDPNGPDWVDVRTPTAR